MENNKLSEKQKDNVRRILAVAHRHLDRMKKEAPVGESIEIANREAQIDSFFEKEGIVDDRAS